MVGFNRRFAPMTVRMKSFLAAISEPLALHYRINAGHLPPDHWVNDREQGGGRILGEVCHFVDLLMFLADSPIVEVQGRSIGNAGRYSGDNRADLASFCQRFGRNNQLSRKWRSVILQRAHRSVWRRKHGGSRRFSPSGTRPRRPQRDGAFPLASGQRTSRRVGRIRPLRAEALSPLPIRFEDIVCSTLATLRIDESVATGKALAVDASAFLKSSSTNVWL